MRFFSKLAAIATLTLAFATASQAQGLINPLLPVRGTKEVALRGSLQFEPGDVFSIDASWGPFIDDARIQVGVSAGYSGSDAIDVTSLGAFANYHFPGPSQLLPFIGVFLGYTNVDGTGPGDGNSTSYGLQGGVKYFINSSVALHGVLEYRTFDDDALDEEIALKFGLAIYLR